MTRLNCTVTNCVYNEHELCVREGIHVDGKNARTKHNTCCSSFSNGTSTTGYSNSTASSAARPETDVRCEACDCTYNEDRCCCAPQVSVCGCGARECAETDCDTFEHRPTI